MQKLVLSKRDFSKLIEKKNKRKKEMKKRKYESLENTFKCWMIFL
jgi:hypothetical protein